jgi:hypothetical protein
MEGTNTRPGDARRLVLGFDAGCMTCSELARRIEDRVGDKVEVRSLNDPTMDHWRGEVFGEDAPWAPTLVELDGGPVKAWTGVRIGARLSRALGPVATWRVMQVLGRSTQTSISPIRRPPGRYRVSPAVSFSKAWAGRRLRCPSCPGPASRRLRRMRPPRSTTKGGPAPR